jgi:C_GCAxxG_C_C family probable redox protein
VTQPVGFFQSPSLTLRGGDKDLENRVLVEKAGEKARSLFLEKRANCAEAVFRAVQEMIDSDLPPEVCGLITPLGGGVAIRGANCGAMLAGLMAMALIYGRAAPYGKSLEENRSDLWKTYALYNQLPYRFKEKFGTYECWDLTKDHIYGTKKCREFCEGIISETAGMVMELLLEAKGNGLHFDFKESLLSQAAEATGLSVEELIEYKTRAEPFPLKGNKPSLGGDPGKTRNSRGGEE